MKSSFNYSDIREMSIGVTILWADEVREKFKKLSSYELEEAKRKMLTTSALIIQWEAKKEAPVDTWILRKSIQYTIYPNYWLIYSPLSYALFVHEGTKPHSIKAVKKKSLYREKDWIGYFAKSVKHPWTKANPFFTRAVEQTKDKVIAKCNEILQSVINNL